LNALKESVATITKSLNYRSSDEAKYYEDMADEAGEITNQKNAALLKGCESLVDAIVKLGDSRDYTCKEIFNTSVFKDFQSTLAAQNKVKELLDKSDETKSLVVSRLNDVSEQLTKVEAVLTHLNDYMYDFTHLDETQVFLPNMIVPFAKAVHSTQSFLQGKFHSVSDEQLEDLEKKLSEETRQKNGFMKVIQFIFEKHPDMKNEVAKHSTHKKFISKLEPGRKRGRPKGSTSKNKKQKS
jgi:hypothetical protein